MIINDVKTQNFEEIFAKQRSNAQNLRKEPISRRRSRLRTIKHWIHKNRRDIHEALRSDLNKAEQETDLSEIYPVLTELKEAMAKVERWASPKRYGSSIAFLGTKGRLYFEPKGTSLIVSPWNYPFNLSIGPLVSAIAAGNTAIIKPSEFTPATSALIVSMINDLFEDSLVKVIEGDADVSKELIKLPFDHIFFTGSPSIGRVIMKAAAENLSSVTLELGGKSPTIVDASANVKDAAAKIAWAKWLNAGQTCVAPDYLFIHASKKTQFVDELKKQVERIYRNDHDYSSIVNSKHYDRLNAAIQDSMAKGAKLEFGGKVDDEKLRIYPSAFSQVDWSSQLLTEEIFGPLLPIVTFDDLDEVITKVNELPKPLALYLFSRNGKNKKRILKETSSGTAMINDAVVQFAHPSLPFGGVNNSGMGKAHGFHGFQAFSNEKSVLHQRVGFTVVRTLYPPYNSLKNKVINLMLRYF